MGTGHPPLTPRPGDPVVPPCNAHQHGHGHPGASGPDLLHSHAHPHGVHHHHLAAPASGWRYGLAILLNVGIVVVQLVAGFAIGSTALLADAWHNLSDVLGLLLAAVAAWAMTLAASPRRTYGFGKAGVLAAVLNGLLLVFACGALALEAVSRLLDPATTAPAAAVVTGVAAVAVVINLLSGWLLMGGAREDVNRRAAVLHLFADAAVSAAVMVAGLLIGLTGAAVIDPIATLLVVAVILAGTWRLLRTSLDLALDAVPSRIDVTAVRSWLAGLPGVEAVHDLHIWPMSATETALTVHLVVPAGGGDGLLAVANEGLGRQFGISHATIQVEQTDIDPCSGLHG